MITLKSEAEIEFMRKAGKITADTLRLIEEKIKVGITTEQLDKIAYEYIKSQGAEPAFLGYNGFKGTCCFSVNDEVIHGIPSERALKDGDVLSVDTGAVYMGWYGDSARTYGVGQVSETDKKLIDTTKEAFLEGANVLKDGVRLGDIGRAIQAHAEKNGFSVVREYVGHGIGSKMHEDPCVPNYGETGRGGRLSAGMTLAIEPMVNAGGYQVKVLADGWTVVTADGKKSAHYENTVLITENGYEILTQ